MLPNIAKKCVLLLLIVNPVIPNCTNFKWIDKNDNNYVWAITGEWRVFDCRVSNNDDVDVKLLLNKNKEIRMDGNRIKEESKNLFNITHLRLADEGRYYCQACGKMKKPLTVVVNKGKAFAKPEINQQRNTKVKYETTVRLECALKGTYVDYELLWFKESKTGEIRALKSKTQSTWARNYNNSVQREVVTVENFTKKNEGKYFCRARRQAVNYVNDVFVHLELETLQKPSYSNFSSSNGRKIGDGNENEDYVLTYHVSGTPPPRISWFKFVNGKEELITECSGKTNMCSVISNNDFEVTMKSFVIKNVSYLEHHNVTYICRSSNIQGHDERKFTMFVKTKPRLIGIPKPGVQLHQTNSQLQCEISRDANPAGVSFSWISCVKGNDVVLKSCNTSDQWRKVDGYENKSVCQIDQVQPGEVKLYRCIAENEINSVQLTWTIVKLTGKYIPKSILCDDHNVHNKVVSEKKEKNDGSSIEPIVMWQCIAAFLGLTLILTFMLMLTYRRRNPGLKQIYQTCVLPLLKEKTGDKV